MKIFDCFKFFNEIELLDLRLHVLGDLVDYFILVEANKTHTGKKKEFIFEHHKDKFKDYLDRIVYVKVEDLPDYSRDDIWLAENFQRNCISRGLHAAKNGDKIIVSDIDEIPNPSTIRSVLDSNKPVTMYQYLFYYYVNCIQNSLWFGSIIATYGQYDSPQSLRNLARTEYNPLRPGGWHYSFMGGAERVRQKVESIAESHLIIDNVGSVEEIERKMVSQKDLWNRKDIYAQKRIIDITQPGLAPTCLNWFINKYPDFYFRG